jgi:dihydrofolate reductase
MSKVKVAAFSVSIDGFGAGPRQSLQAPLGVGGEQMHEWMFPTRTFKRMFGAEGGSTGADDRYAARSFENVGAWILGRNMFGPVRGPWPDEEWKGWWGDEPPYHVPVFVLTHHARPSLAMKGGTVFHFVTGGAEAALKLAKEAAASKDVRIGGGVSTIRQDLEAGLIDEMHLAVSPVLLGHGESLLGGLDMPALGWRVSEREGTAQALHLVMTREK